MVFRWYYAFVLTSMTTFWSSPAHIQSCKYKIILTGIHPRVHTHTHALSNRSVFFCPFHFHDQSAYGDRKGMSKTLHCYLSHVFPLVKGGNHFAGANLGTLPHTPLWSHFRRRKHFHFSLLRKATHHSRCVNDVWTVHGLYTYCRVVKIRFKNNF